MSSFFPYSYRPYQKELVDFIKENVRDNILLIEAPTGFGKTPVILSALLEKITENGGHIIWAVRTGNETDRPIEELKEIVKKTKIPVFGISYRGKKDMCLLAREMNLTDYSDVSYVCQKKRKECIYYKNFRKFKFTKLPTQPMLYSEVLEFARQNNVCPYYLQRELLNFADVISLSYNYIVSDLGWSIKRIVPFYESYLVVDEAHNLQFIVGNLFSDKITLNTVRRALNELESIGKKDTIAYRQLSNFLKFLIKFGKGFEEEKEFDPILVLNASKLSKEIIEQIYNFGVKIRTKLLNEGKAPRSSLYHFGKFWLDSLAIYGTDGIAFLASKEKDNITLERWDMRSAEILKDRWPEFYSIVFCSGTLRPTKAFVETVGVSSYKAKIVPSIFDLNRIKSFILTDVSTRGEQLNEEVKERIIMAIELFLSVFDKNIAIFNASYRIQGELLEELKKLSKKYNRKLFVEYEGMPGDEGRLILDSFKKAAYSGQKGLLVASMSGRFAEGADFPGVELEGVFLVGIPFDRVTARTKLYIKYYTKLYGKKRGYYLSYIVPAMRRASQSLGRALRSEEDGAIFILGDKRYKQKIYFNLLPYYVRKTTSQIEVERIPQVVKEYIKFQQKYLQIKRYLLDTINQKKGISMIYKEANGSLKEYHVLPESFSRGILIAKNVDNNIHLRFNVSRIVSLKTD